MKSNKQRRKELKTARSQRAERQKKSQLARAKVLPAGTVAVDHTRLAPNNSYTIPPDYYVDQPFTCRDCGVEQVWTAQQQKWWCEVAQGSIFSTAIRCRACRKVERDRKAEARRVHLEGVAKKLEQQQARG